MIKVYTETQCDVCGKINRREGAEGECPAVHWARVRLTYRFDGEGWTNSQDEEAILCPTCAEKVFELVWETK